MNALTIKKSTAAYVFCAVLACLTLAIGGGLLGLAKFDLIQKLVLLAFAILAIALFGTTVSGLLPLVGFVGVVSISLIMAWLGAASPDFVLFFMSLASMCTGLIFYATRMPNFLIQGIARTIMILPLLSVAMAILLFPITGRAPWATEYTGAYRLGGALPPAHLAMLCVAALMMYSFRMSIQAHEVRKPILAPLVIFLILLATGTRGALLAGVVVMLPHLRLPREKRMFLFMGLLLLPLTYVFYAGIENLFSRTGQQVDYENVNLSGRTVAWQFFLEKSKENFYFGKGLGAVTTLTANEKHANLSFFIVPHNEYIRFLVDIGSVGLALLVVGLFVFFADIGRRLGKGMRSAFYGVVGAFFLYSFVDNTFGTPQFFVVFLLLLRCVQAMACESTSSDIQNKGRVWSLSR